MINEFTDLKLSKNNLQSFIIRSEILKAISVAIPTFHGEVLDSGCGCMPYKELVLKNKLVKKYVGMDIDYGLNYSDVKPDILWDGLVMPFDDNHFDIVISTEVLEHIADPYQYLNEVKRVLKPGGSFFFTVPFLMSLHEVPHDYYRYTPYALDRIFNKVEFDTIKIKPMGGYHAAVAHMLGLWVNMFLWGNKKKLMRIVVQPIISILYKNDKPPLNFKKSTMIVGLAGTVRKPF